MSISVVAEQVVKTYRDGARRTLVLKGVDLVVEPGELVAVVGPSGSGKSTLLHCLGALDRPDSGRVVVAGEELARLGLTHLAAFRNRTIGFVFQFHQLLPDFTALENVLIPARIARRPPREVLEAALALLDEVGLAERLDHFPSQLSGGERQRLALCRALLLEPPLLLADEPTGNLDPKNGEQVLRLLFDLHRRRGTTAVLVTHNPEVAQRSDRVLTLADGVLTG